MAEPQHELRDNLEKLRGQIDQTTPADAAAKQRLDALKQHVDSALVPPGPDQPHPYQSLRERLSENVEHFEEGHAELTLTIDRILSNLAAIGL